MIFEERRWKKNGASPVSLAAIITEYEPHCSRWWGQWGLLLTRAGTTLRETPSLSIRSNSVPFYLTEIMSVE